MIYSCDEKLDVQQQLLQSSVSHDPSEIMLIYYWCWKQLCCLIFYFGPCVTFLTFLNKCKKEQHLFNIEIYCNNIHYCSKVWVQYFYFILNFLKEFSTSIQEGCVKCIKMWIRNQNHYILGFPSKIISHKSTNSAGVVTFFLKKRGGFPTVARL